MNKAMLPYANIEMNTLLGRHMGWERNARKIPWVYTEIWHTIPKLTEYADNFSLAISKIEHRRQYNLTSIRNIACF